MLFLIVYLISVIFVFSSHFDCLVLMQFSLVCLFTLNSSLFQNHTMVCLLLELQYFYKVGAI